MAEHVGQRLPALILDGLCSGRPIAADVVILAANYRAIPDIPLSEYAAAVTVFPLMSKYISPEDRRYQIVREEEPRYGFRLMYREVPERYLADEYSYDWDLYASLTEDRIVTSVEELEEALSGYVKDFGAFYFGTGLW